VVGGSTAFGHGLAPGEQTFCRALESSTGRRLLNAGVSAVAAAIQKSNGPIKWEDGIIEAWKRIIAARPTAANGVRERFISAA